MIQDSLKFAVDLGFCQSGQTAVVTSGQMIGFLEGNLYLNALMSI